MMRLAQRLTGGAKASGNPGMRQCRIMTAPLSPAPDPVLAVRAATEAMLGTIAVARALVEGGRRVDLAGLDREIGTICAAALALPAAEGQQLRPTLETLAQAVDGLARLLRAPAAGLAR